MADPLRILHVITNFPIGGAQSVLVRLVAEHQAAGIASHVVSLLPRLEGAAPLVEGGVPVETLGVDRLAAIPNLGRLVTILRRERPHVVQTWLYHADLLTGLAARAAGGPPVVWNLRQSNLDPRGTKRATRLVVRCCARTSAWLPHTIVCGSTAAKITHAAVGYDASRMTVIPNGFDVDVLRPDPAARESLRAEIGIPDSTIAIGLVARFDPQKDHRTFFRAAALLRDSPDVRFVLCGEAVDAANAELARWIAEAGVGDRVHLLGPRRDVARVFAALDVATSSSFGEGFPNVVAEAMACGIPCVVTDAGDSKEVVGETGIVVPCEDPAALAAGWRRLIAAPREERARLGAAARARIAEHFGIRRMADRYAELYRGIASDVRH